MRRGAGLIRVGLVRAGLVRVGLVRVGLVRVGLVRVGLGLLVSAGLAGCALAQAKVATPPATPRGVHGGGSIVVAITAPSGIDPLDADEPTGKLISGLLCDTLISQNPVTGRPEPGLVSSWETVGPVLTLKLRHGLKLSNGQTLNAKDVVDSLAALANPANASREAGLLSEVAGDSTLAKNLFASSRASLVGVTVVDPYDLQVNLTTADPGFVLALTEPATAPVLASAEAADPTKFAADPVCVGPYVLKAPYHPGDRRIVLERNADYYAQNVAYTGGGAGYLRTITFDVFGTPAAAYAAVRAGKADLAEVPTSVKSVAGARGLAVETGPVPAEEFIGIPDGLTSALSGSAVHQALSEALDRTAIVRAAWGGQAQPASGFLPAALGRVAADSGCPAARSASGDVAAARALLSASQRSALAHATVSFTVNSSPVNLAEAHAVAAQWHAAFGMTVKVVAVSGSAYLQQATLGGGFTGPFRISWSADSATPQATYPDPSQMLGPLFLSSGSDSANLADYQNYPFQLDFSNALSATLGLDRQQHFQSLARTLCAQMPIIPIATGAVQWTISTKYASARSTFLSLEGEPLLREFYER